MFTRESMACRRAVWRGDSVDCIAVTTYDAVWMSEKWDTRHMAALTVRNVEEELVRKLKRRAVEEGVSAEELHRRILRRALMGPRRSGTELVAALRKLGEIGLVVEPDRRWEPPKIEF